MVLKLSYVLLFGLMTCMLWDAVMSSSFHEINESNTIALNEKIAENIERIIKHNPQDVWIVINKARKFMGHIHNCGTIRCQNARKTIAHVKNEINKIQGNRISNSMVKKVLEEVTKTLKDRIAKNTIHKIADTIYLIGRTVRLRKYNTFLGDLYAIAENPNTLKVFAEIDQGIRNILMNEQKIATLVALARYLYPPTEKSTAENAADSFKKIEKVHFDKPEAEEDEISLDSAPVAEDTLPASKLNEVLEEETSSEGEITEEEKKEALSDSKPVDEEPETIEMKLKEEELPEGKLWAKEEEESTANESNLREEETPLFKEQKYREEGASSEDKSAVAEGILSGTEGKFETEELTQNGENEAPFEEQKSGEEETLSKNKPILAEKTFSSKEGRFEEEKSSKAGEGEETTQCNEQKLQEEETSSEDDESTTVEKTLSDKEGRFEEEEPSKAGKEEETRQSNKQKFREEERSSEDEFTEAVKILSGKEGKFDEKKPSKDDKGEETHPVHEQKSRKEIKSSEDEPNVAEEALSDKEEEFEEKESSQAVEPTDEDQGSLSTEVTTGGKKTSSVNNELHEKLSGGESTAEQKVGPSTNKLELQEDEFSDKKSTDEEESTINKSSVHGKERLTIDAPTPRRDDVELSLNKGEVHQNMELLDDERGAEKEEKISSPAEKKFQEKILEDDEHATDDKERMAQDHKYMAEVHEYTNKDHENMAEKGEKLPNDESAGRGKVLSAKNGKFEQEEEEQHPADEPPVEQEKTYSKEVGSKGDKQKEMDSQTRYNFF